MQNKDLRLQALEYNVNLQYVNSVFNASTLYMSVINDYIRSF